MAAGLGQSSDPRALVPGTPEAIEADAGALTAYAGRVDQVGQGLKRVDVGGWQGAAGQGFAAAFGREPVKWLKLADSIDMVTGAMTSYAQTLRWAQGQAGEAARLWELGARATAEARARYQAAASAADTATGPFTDPGEQYRGRAQELLDRAREQLRQAGDQAARIIGGQPLGTSGRALGALDSLVEAVTDGWRGRDAEAETGPGAGVKSSVGEGGKLAELKAYAQLRGLSWAGELRNGDVTLGGNATAEVGAAATVSASAGDAGISGRAAASVGAEASVQGQVSDGGLGLYGRAGASAGAEASAGVVVDRSGVGAELGASVGLKAKAAAGIEVAGIRIGGTAEGWLGAGAAAGFGFEKTEDGKFHLGGYAGIAPGAGGKLGAEITVDPAAVERSARDAADAVGHGMRVAASQLNPFDQEAPE
jgi:uncharacterized protein YukE